MRKIQALTFSFLALMFFISINVGYGQVNIIPVRTDVSGFPTWTDVNVAGTTYLQLLKASSYTISPAMDFNSYNNEVLMFKARTYGGGNPVENTATIWISTDNGNNWVSIGTVTPTTTTLTAMSPFDLSSYNGAQVMVKFTVAGTNDGVGIGIDDITFQGVPGSSTPIITVTNTMTQFTAIVGTRSAEQVYSVTGTNLTNDITVTPPVGFEISLTSGGTFVANPNSITLGPTGGSVFVRFAPTLIQTYSGTINHVSGSTTATTPVSGVGTNSLVVNEGFNNGVTPPDGWIFTNLGGTYTSSGNYGIASPSLRMDVTGAQITTPTFTSATKISFWIKGQGTNSTSSLLVEEYYSSTWNTKEVISPLPTTGTTYTYDLTSGTTQLRFTYTKSAGNLAFDDLSSDFALPVVLNSFTSNVQNNTITLNWTTATEMNNSHFDIERKDNNAWYKIGSITGSGTTTTEHHYVYTDRNLTSGTYSYRLRQVDYNGNFEYYTLSAAVVIGAPKTFSVISYPNPFNPIATIKYSLPQDADVQIVVFNALGQRITTLVNEYKTAGFYSVQLDGNSLSSGLYFYRITAGNYSAVKKVMLIK